MLVLILFSLGGLFASDTILSKPKIQSQFLQDPKQSPNAEELKESFGVASKINLWGYFWKITFICILMVGMVFAISKYKGNNSFTKKDSQTGQHLNILYQQYLSSKQKIILVRAFDKYLLLGVSEQSINFLTEFSKNEIDEEQINITNSKSLFTTLLGRFAQNEK